MFSFSVDAERCAELQLLCDDEAERARVRREWDEHVRRGADEDLHRFNYFGSVIGEPDQVLYELRAVPPRVQDLRLDLPLSDMVENDLDGAQALAAELLPLVPAAYVDGLIPILGPTALKLVLYPDGSRSLRSGPVDFAGGRFAVDITKLGKLRLAQLSVRRP